MTMINYAKYDKDGVVYEIGRIQNEYIQAMVDGGQSVVYVDPPQNLEIGEFSIDVNTKQIIRNTSNDLPGSPY